MGVGFLLAILSLISGKSLHFAVFCARTQLEIEPDANKSQTSHFTTVLTTKRMRMLNVSQN